MSYRQDSEVGWSEYYDARDEMGDLGSMGAADFEYVPDLGPVGTGAAGNYYPRDTQADADALHFLGFMPDGAWSDHVGTTGSQAGDMAQAAGAWDPAFQAAVRAFQSTAGTTADGWIGPNTRQKLQAAVQAKNAGQSPIAPPFVIPPVSPPISPNVIPPSSPSKPTPAPVKAGFNWPLVLGAAAVLGGGYYLLKK